MCPKAYRSRIKIQICKTADRIWFLLNPSLKGNVNIYRNKKKINFIVYITKTYTIIGGGTYLGLATWIK